MRRWPRCFIGLRCPKSERLADCHVQAPPKKRQRSGGAALSGGTNDHEPHSSSILLLWNQLTIVGFFMAAHYCTVSEIVWNASPDLGSEVDRRKEVLGASRLKFVQNPPRGERRVVGEISSSSSIQSRMKSSLFILVPRQCYESRTDQRALRICYVSELTNTDLYQLLYNRPTNKKKPQVHSSLLNVLLHD